MSGVSIQCNICKIDAIKLDNGYQCPQCKKMIVSSSNGNLNISDTENGGITIEA